MDVDPCDDTIFRRIPCPYGGGGESSSDSTERGMEVDVVDEEASMSDFGKPRPIGFPTLFFPLLDLPLDNVRSSVRVDSESTSLTDVSSTSAALALIRPRSLRAGSRPFRAYAERDVSEGSFVGLDGSCEDEEVNGLLEEVDDVFR